MTPPASSAQRLAKRANTGSRARERWLSASLGLLMASGVAFGWFFAPAHARTLDYLYAAVSPTCLALACASALSPPAKHAKWLVPLLLISVVLSAATRPHVALLTAIGAIAGSFAIGACLSGRQRSSIVGVLICCAAISASLLIALWKSDPTGYPK